MIQTTIALATCLFVAAPVLAQNRVYKVLATSKTSTMQKEMHEAGGAGYRFVAVMGGETAIGGKEVVVLMEKTEGDKRTYAFRNRNRESDAEPPAASARRGISPVFASSRRESRRSAWRSAGTANALCSGCARLSGPKI